MELANPTTTRSTLSFHDLTWSSFIGNEVSSRELKEICMFRSKVLYDNGRRKKFSQDGSLYGDLSLEDKNSYHLLAKHQGKLIGSIRMTPPGNRNVAISVLGLDGYLQFLNNINADIKSTFEMNRLMIDPQYQAMGIGKFLIFGSIALVNHFYNIHDIKVIGVAGNCMRQTDFCLKYTNFQRLPDVEDEFSHDFEDRVSFLTYPAPPYSKGEKEMRFFADLFNKMEKKKRLERHLSDTKRLYA